MLSRSINLHWYHHTLGSRFYHIPLHFLLFWLLMTQDQDLYLQISPFYFIVSTVSTHPSYLRSHLPIISLPILLGPSSPLLYLNPIKCLHEINQVSSWFTSSKVSLRYTLPIIIVIFVVFPHRSHTFLSPFWYIPIHPHHLDILQNFWILPDPYRIRQILILSTWVIPSLPPTVHWDSLLTSVPPLGQALSCWDRKAHAFSHSLSTYFLPPFCSFSFAYII